MTTSSLPPDYSSSSPLPSPPLRPFSRFPTELVQHIIESTVPFSFHSTTHVTRQTTLRSLCLVSRLFFQIAQPLLFAIVRFGKQQDIAAWRAAVDHHSRPSTSREMVLQAKVSHSFSSNALRTLFSFQKDIKTLSISTHNHPVDVSLLVGLSNLATLRLAHVELLSPGTSVLSKLEVLQLMNVQSHEPIHKLFNPSTVPKLHAIALYIPTETDTDTSILLAALDSQLDCFALDQISTRGISPEVCARILRKTLLSSAVARYSPELELNNLNMRLYIPSELARGGIQLPDLKRLVINLSVCSSGAVPSLLYLPNKSENATETSIEYVKLSQVCKKRNIELVFEEQPSDWTIDPAVSMDFWKRMREARLKEGNA